MSFDDEKLNKKTLELPDTSEEVKPEKGEQKPKNK
jgi:hypothetical protein